MPNVIESKQIKACYINNKKIQLLKNTINNSVTTYSCKVFNNDEYVNNLVSSQELGKKLETASRYFDNMMKFYKRG